MPFTPDPPYPKAQGDIIRSDDWNDAIEEIKRLDTAKVNKAGDAMTGPLTIKDASPELTLLRTNNAQLSRILFRNSGGNYITNIHTTGTINGDLVIRVGTGNVDPQSLPDRLTIANNGNVGIGKTGPSEKLHIESNTETNILLKTTGVASTRIKLQPATGGIGALQNLAGDLQIGSLNAIRVGTGSGGALDGGFIERFTILPDGNVGIGVNSPKNKLDVEGAAVIGSSYSGTRTAPSNGLLIQGSVGIGTDPGDKLDVNGDIRIRGADIKDAGGTTRIRLTDDGNLELREDNGNTVLIIGTDRRVGIGTSYLLSKLTVKGDYGWKIGDVAIHNGSTEVVGIGTSFLSDVGIGDQIYVKDGGYRNVTGISSDTVLLVDSAFTVTGSGKDWWINKSLFRADRYNGDPVFIISDQGHVGIGTITPGGDRLDVHGRCYSSGGWETTDYDYAEYFETNDGKAIPVATPVILTPEGKIRTAKKGEVPIGITTTSSAVVGNSFKEWPQKYLRDEFGNRIMEKVKEEIKIPKKKKITKERQKIKRETVTEEVIRQDIVLEKGKYIRKEKTEKITREVEVPLFEEVDLYEPTIKKIIGKHRVPVMESYEEEITVLDENGSPVLEGSGEFITEVRPKLNPKYDKTKHYIPRRERPEWCCVGLLGQLALRKGKPVAPTWSKIKDLSDKAELWLVK